MSVKKNNRAPEDVEDDREKESVVVYANALRDRLLRHRHLLGGCGDLRIHILTSDNELTLVRILFTKGKGSVRHSHDDEEWNACMQWIRNVSDHRKERIVPGRILISGDLCVVITRGHDESYAEEDAEAIIDALLTWHGKRGVGSGYVM